MMIESIYLLKWSINFSVIYLIGQCLITWLYTDLMNSLLLVTKQKTLLLYLLYCLSEFMVDFAVMLRLKYVSLQHWQDGSCFNWFSWWRANSYKTSRSSPKGVIFVLTFLWPLCCFTVLCATEDVLVSLFEQITRLFAIHSHLCASLMAGLAVARRSAVCTKHMSCHI